MMRSTFGAASYSLIDSCRLTATLPLSPVILFWLYSAVYMIYGLDACQDPANVTQIPGIDFPDISASTCDWGTAATFNICAVVCWLGCGFLLCCTPQVRILTT